jgi:MED6 mediator sub complex component
MPPGIEFVITFVSEPALYVIKRQYRHSPESATQQAFYYVLFGNVYQAPTLLACLRARSRRCAHNLGVAFQQFKKDLEPLQWRERQRAKQLRRGAAAAAAVAGAGAGSDVKAAQADTLLAEAAAAGASTPGHDRQGRDSPASTAAQAVHAPQGAEQAAGPSTAGPRSGVDNAQSRAVAMEQEAAKAIVQQDPLTAEGWKWMKRTDDVILNVLGRYAATACMQLCP